jgi:NAD(P)-dependent dehydrogenase (short-subunit alcohol dehydrogenase family)
MPPHFNKSSDFLRPGLFHSKGCGKDYGKPDDIAYCVCYLLSDASKYITGQDFIVDGGYVD